MGGCLSKPGKRNDRGRWKDRKASASLSIPVSGLPANSNPGSAKDRLSWGPEDEIWFDSIPWFEVESSDDEFLSVDQDFHPPKKSSYASLKEGVSKVTAWIAGPSGRPCRETGEFPRLNSLPPTLDSGSISGNYASNLSCTSKALEGCEQPLPNGVESAAVDRTSFTRVMKWDKVLSLDIPCRKPSTSEASPVCSSGRSTCSDGQTCGKSGKAGDDGPKSSFDSSCIPRLLNSVTLRISFKRRSGGEALDSSIHALERPIAGSQLPRCSSNEVTEGCWSRINPATFKLRGANYFRDKKKSSAPNFAIFEPLGVDVFLTSRKIDHIAQHLELPWQNLERETSDLPHILIVNAQVPSYPPAVFLGETDGEGYSICMYYKLSDAFKKQSSSHLQEMLQKFVNDDMEKVRGIVGESTLSFRERLKVVARLQNLEELQTSGTEKKLLLSYNEKPILSRPQHVFYRGLDYLEIDLDVHRFSYIARKGLDTIRERLKLSVLDIGLTIQAQRSDELPEHVLCSVRLNKVDFRNFKHLHTPDPIISSSGGVTEKLTSPMPEPWIKLSWTESAEVVGGQPTGYCNMVISAIQRVHCLVSANGTTSTNKQAITLVKLQAPYRTGISDDKWLQSGLSIQTAVNQQTDDPGQLNFIKRRQVLDFPKIGFALAALSKRASLLFYEHEKQSAAAKKCH